MPVATVNDLEKLSPVFRGKAGNALLRGMMRLTGVSKVNDLYDRVAPLQGSAFAEGILKEVGVDYLLADSLNAAEAQRSPEEKQVLARYFREQMAELDYGDVPPEAH